MNPSAHDRIEKQVEIKGSVDRVWKALTDFREFGEWFRVALENPFVVGGETRGRILYPGYEHLVFEVEVAAITPKTYFAFRWHPYAIDSAVDYSKESPTLVEFHLEPKSDGVLLRVVESGFDAIPANRRDEAFRMNSKGWEIQMTNIREFVLHARG
ncbi:MAG: SRPBCC family protein [Phycisphaeraceae bacterium]|nr:SRPBCC family protein [Phycisphaeraceae bacterium]